MSEKWEWVTLDKLGNIEAGRQASKLDNSLFEGGNIPLIGGEEVSKSRFSVNPEVKKFYNLKGLRQSKLFSKGKILFIRSGNSAGDSSFLNFDSCLTQNLYSFSSFKEISDPKFVKYCFNFQNLKTKLIVLSKLQTAQPNLTLTKLFQVKFPKPPLDIQQKIGEILSRYDLILDNNEKQIQLLKNLKISLFKEWFVKLRFPDYESYSIRGGSYLKAERESK
ncbi:restriction endonuclease subunit S [Mycoplasma suis]|uniref:restriction endonuclease subunit S n=1 Tax=Mycoplasma suis TaxID=57372 RepID=UPI0002EF5915|nr:restriction endonuclease subunit S [Mycoplasma suis]